MQGDVQATEQAKQDVLQTSNFLLSFFHCVCSMGQEHPCLVQTQAACLGDYAAWFGRYPASFFLVAAALLACDGV